MQACDHAGIVLFHEPRGWDRSISLMPRKFQVPPTDAASLLSPGCHYAPNEPSPAPFPFPFVRHQDSLNKEWRVFIFENHEITKHEIPVGLTHIGKLGRVKANWFLIAETLNGAPDKNIYFRMFARSGSNMDPNITKKVYAN